MSVTDQKMLQHSVESSKQDRGSLGGHRWIVALIASLMAHALFWMLRDALPVSDTPKIESKGSLSVTLIAAPAKAGPTATSNPVQQNLKPLDPPKPKIIPKPKLQVTKPEMKRPVEPLPTKAAEPTPSEAPPATPASSSPTSVVAPPANSSSSSSPTATSSAESAEGKYEGPKLNAGYLHNPRPDYPPQAKRMGWEGRVVLRVEVLSDGTVGTVSVAKTSDHESLDEAALAAVRQWKFVPAKRNGQPVTSSVNVPINFNLKNE